MAKMSIDNMRINVERARSAISAIAGEAILHDEEDIVQSCKNVARELNALARGISDADLRRPEDV